jgi:hypothetical protein
MDVHRCLLLTNIAEPGGARRYGPRITGQVLRDATPADIAVQQTDRFDAIYR